MLESASVPTFEQGNAWQALWASTFISELVCSLTSPLWAVPSSTGDFRQFKVRAAGSSPSWGWSRLWVLWGCTVLFYLHRSVGELQSPSPGRSMNLSFLRPASQTEKSGEGPAISLDQDEPLIDKESERKKCQTRQKDLKSQYLGKVKTPFLQHPPWQTWNLKFYEILLFLNDKDISPHLFPPFQTGLVPTQKWCG